MKPCASPVAACRHCRHYVPEGRRGGSCQKLNVDVQGSWSACSFAVSPFEADWHLDATVWQTPLVPALHPMAMKIVPVEVVA
jgi:hypothetical protein